MTETSENSGRNTRAGPGREPRTSEGGGQSRRSLGERLARIDHPAWGLAGLKLVIQLTALTRYGWFRDELYYVACSERLAWGYVDHPPLSIALLRVWRAVFGDSLAAIRLVPALAGAAVVFLTVRTARALGATTRGAALAGLAVIAAPGFVGFHHYYSMNAIDHLVWSIVGALAVRLATDPARRGADARLWVALGLVVGLGATNKWSVAWLAAGVAIGLALTTARAALRTRWPWIAVGLAALVALPHVAWEVGRGWPTLEFMKNALEQKYVARSTGAFLGELALLVNPLAVPILLGAVALAVKRPAARPPASIFVATLLFVGSSRSGKAEYVLAAAPLAAAAGATFWEAFVARRGRAWRVALASLVVAMVAFGGATLPFGVPILDEAAFVGYQRSLGIAPSSSEKKELAELPQFYADMHGWPELTDAAALAFATLDPDDKRRAKIWARTGGYGPAAAIDFFGRSRGLPRAIAAHNSYWTWGYGDDDRSVTIVLGGARERLEPLFEELVLVTTFECRWCMPYENHKPIWIARRMRRSWAELWPEVRRYE